MVTHETRSRDRVKILYYKNVESHDAELIRLRDTAYKGDTGYMISVYQARLQHPNADFKTLTHDIKRLRHIKNFEEGLPRLGLLLGGQAITSVSALVEKYESERNNVNSKDTQTIDPAITEATPRSMSCMLQDFYEKEVAKEGEYVDLIVECENTWNNDLQQMRQAYENSSTKKGCLHDLKRIDRLMDLQTGLDQLNLRVDGKKVDLAYLVGEYESERAARMPQSGEQLIRKYFGPSGQTKKETG